MRNTIEDGGKWRILADLGWQVALIGAMLATTFNAPVVALDPILAEEYCNRAGLTKPVRQTIVVLDQGLVVPNPEGGVAPENQRWLKDLHSLLDPSAPGRVATFLPRERVSLYLGPSSGVQPELLFTGCIPRFSADEIASMEKERSSSGQVIDYLFKSGAPNAAADYAKQFFQRKVTIQLGQIGPSGKSEGGSTPSILRSLARDRQLINLQNGIPRIILLTDLSGAANAAGSDTASARAWGFSQAKEIGLRLQRAEVYLIGKSSGHMRDAMEAFFLASEGDLVGWSDEMLGVFGANPASVQVFRGQVSYCENQFPMELRLSVDSEGQLKDSWLAVSVQERTSTPVKGALVCEAPQRCSLTSRDSGLGQLWSTKGEGGAAKPELSATLPLSGFRRLDATLDGQQLTGRIWDPVAKLDCTNKDATNYSFRLIKAEGIPF